MKKNSWDSILLPIPIFATKRETRVAACTEISSERKFSKKQTILPKHITQLVQQPIIQLNSFTRMMPLSVKFIHAKAFDVTNFKCSPRMLVYFIVYVLIEPVSQQAAKLDMDFYNSF